MKNEFFEIKENGELFLKPETLNIPVFKALQDKYKKEATNYFSYIYHTLDFDSPYRVYPDKERKRIVGGAYKVKTDCEYLQNAIKQYESFQNTPLYRLWKSTLEACFALEMFFSNIQINEENVKKVTDSMKGIGALINSLKDLEDQVRKERQDKSNVRGGGEINPREK